MPLSSGGSDIVAADPPTFPSSAEGNYGHDRPFQVSGVAINCTRAASNDTSAPRNEGGVVAEAKRFRARLLVLTCSGPIMSDTYRTLGASSRAKQTVDGSRFLADAMPVSTRDEASDGLGAVRDREPNATHHCWAYRLGKAGDDVRYDDDGEPGGTAGQPILRQIDTRDLTNTLVVVTRYFGGTELGTGGLARAYGKAAAAALDRAPTVERVVRTPVRLRFDYDDTSPAQRVLRRFDTEVRDSDYTDVTTLTVGVRQSEVEAFVDAFTNALSDRGDVLRVGSDGRPDGSRG